MAPLSARSIAHEIAPPRHHITFFKETVEQAHLLVYFTCAKYSNSERLYKLLFDCNNVVHGYWITVDVIMITG